LLVACGGIWAEELPAQGQQTWALDATKIYLAPDVAATSGRVVIAGSKIDSVAPASGKRATAARRASQCSGGVVVAGFQNSHVHFTGDEFRAARDQQPEALDVALTRMLTRYGYTTVFDIASDRDNTLALRDRIEKGEVRGPRILTAGWALFPPHGLPSYISHMRKELLDKLPQPASVDEALEVVRENFAAGADGTKLFLVTPQGDNTVKRMAPDIARAVVDETHRRGRLVFAHPTDIQGIQEALDVRVDILAHPPLGAPVPWPEPLMRQVRHAGMSMIPTLKLFEFELGRSTSRPRPPNGS
jgi:imidazolonepropionase-like amidohydrolase